MSVDADSPTKLPSKTCTLIVFEPLAMPIFTLQDWPGVPSVSTDAAEVFTEALSMVPSGIASPVMVAVGSTKLTSAKSSPSA